MKRSCHNTFVRNSALISAASLFIVFAGIAFFKGGLCSPAHGCSRLELLCGSFRANGCFKVASATCFEAGRAFDHERSAKSFCKRLPQQSHTLLLKARSHHRLCVSAPCICKERVKGLGSFSSLSCAAPHSGMQKHCHERRAVAKRSQQSCALACLPVAMPHL